MEQRQIKELMQWMGRTGMRALKLKRGDFELELEHGPETPKETIVHVPMPNPMQSDMAMHRQEASVVHAAEHSTNPLGHATAGEASPADNGQYITSPMVGTFYLSPSPDDPAFVKSGDKVKEGNVVCIIEAMKVMNEVKSEISGEIVEVLVDNGHPVEFGTKLFRVK